MDESKESIPVSGGNLEEQLPLGADHDLAVSAVVDVAAPASDGRRVIDGVESIAEVGGPLGVLAGEILVYADGEDLKVIIAGVIVFPLEAAVDFPAFVEIEAALDNEAPGIE